MSGSRLKALRLKDSRFNGLRLKDASLSGSRLNGSRLTRSLLTGSRVGKSRFTFRLRKASVMCLPLLRPLPNPFIHIPP
ncbi:MAG: pentapeptide repeat-containing protein [Clostridiales bacterium]|nr:pentapeptide repeat-containing protein [Clostridiales bacterium]